MKVAMAKVTLEQILEEVRAGFAKADDRFDLVKQEFQSLRLDIDERFDKVDARLDTISTDIKAIREQTADTFQVVIDHETRIKAFEGPSA